MAHRGRTPMKSEARSLSARQQATMLLRKTGESTNPGRRTFRRVSVEFDAERNRDLALGVRAPDVQLGDTAIQFGEAVPVAVRPARRRPAARALEDTIADILTANIDDVFSAIRKRQIWPAVLAALRTGALGEFLTLLPALESGAVLADGLLSDLRLVAPTVVRGRKLQEAAERGGRSRLKSPPRSVLEPAVRAMQRERPNLSWTRVTDLVGKQFGISGKTVRRYVPKLRRA